MKTKNKNLLLLLLLLGLPGVVQAQNAYSTNTDGSIYTYSTNADGSANIVAYAGPPWVVTIPTNINSLTVTSIGTNAFEYDSLTNVTIPDSVTSIGDSAFDYCTSLTSVTIGNGVTNIGGEAFFSCASLTSVTIPNSVTSIGVAAFVGSGVTSVTIPNSVTSIGGGAFASCNDLTNITVAASNSAYSSMNGVLFDKAQATLLQFPGGLGGSYTIPNSVTSIADSALALCYSLTSVTIPGSVTSIGPAAFSDCYSLTNATIGNSVTNIGIDAFDSCASLTSVTIPNSVTSIGDSAFNYCTLLKSVTIGTNVTSIGEYAFGVCTNLTSITVDASNPAYSSRNGVLFDKAQASLLEFPGGLGGSYTIPNSVTSIVEDAFYGCGLTSVTIPDSVTSIGPAAFSDCYSLTNATIGNSVTSIGDSVFFRCYSLTSVTIGNRVTSIGDSAFGFCESLTSVTIPNSVTSIGDSAFGFCESLTSVTILGSVTSIGQGAFAFYYSLTSVYFTGNAPSPTNDSTVFYGKYYATVYYLPGTTGWGAMFDGRPTAPWFLPNPVILNGEPSFGVGANGFGFTISWATNASVVVEAATNLANPVWIPVSTSPLVNGTNYFSDPQWTNYPERFYRATSAFTVGGTLTGLPAGDTVMLQDNGSDNLTLSNNGTFTFPTALPNGQSYSVTYRATSSRFGAYTFFTNGSGTISGANVTNVAVTFTPVYTGNPDVDMLNAAVADGTDHGGVPGVMLTEYGGPLRVTAIGLFTHTVALIYSGWARFATIVEPGSCSSTTFPVGTHVIQFGTAFACQPDDLYGY